MNSHIFSWSAAEIYMNFLCNSGKLHMVFQSHLHEISYTYTYSYEFSTNFVCISYEIHTQFEWGPYKIYASFPLHMNFIWRLFYSMHTYVLRSMKIFWIWIHLRGYHRRASALVKDRNFILSCSSDENIVQISILLHNMDRSMFGTVITTLSRSRITSI